jgi:hypothetical protein
MLNLFPMLAQIFNPSTNSAMNQMAIKLVRVSEWTSGAYLYDGFLNPLCTDIAKTILPIILVAEIVFCGFRIMTGRPIIEQAARIMLASIICYVVVWLQMPQKALRYTMRFLEDSGRTVGGGMMFQSGPIQRTRQKVQANSPNTFDPFDAAGVAGGGPLIETYYKFTPVVAWAIWVNPEATSDGPEYKYGYLFIRNRIFPENSGDLIVQTNSQRRPSQSNRTFHESTYYGEVIDAIRNIHANFRIKDKMFETAGVKDPKGITLAESAVGLINIFMPLTAMSLALPISINILAGAVSPMFMTAAVVSGAYFSFYIILAFGVAVVPLLYFETFKTSWQTYLRFVFSVSLVPMLFYIMMGIGFVFSTTIFEFMFPDYDYPSNHNQPGLSMIYAQVLQEGFISALAASNPFNTGIEKLMGSNSGLNFFQLFMLLGRHAAGCIVVTGFILVGTAFGPTAVKLAFKWDQGFAENGIFDNVFQGFETIRGALSSALSVQMGSGMQVAQQVISGVTGAFKYGPGMFRPGGTSIGGKP